MPKGWILNKRINHSKGDRLISAVIAEIVSVKLSNMFVFRETFSRNCVSVIILRTDLTRKDKQA